MNADVEADYDRGGRQHKAKAKRRSGGEVAPLAIAEAKAARASPSAFKVCWRWISGSQSYPHSHRIGRGAWPLIGDSARSFIHVGAWPALFLLCLRCPRRRSLAW